MLDFVYPQQNLNRVLNFRQNWREDIPVGWGKKRSMDKQTESRRHMMRVGISKRNCLAIGRKLK